MTSPEAQLMGTASTAVRSVYQALEAIRSGLYTGWDPGGLATVETDGSGVVQSVRLVPTISRYPGAAIAQAVQTAYEEAEAQRMAALQELGRQARATGAA